MFMIQSTHLNINGYALLVHMDVVCVENVMFNVSHMCILCLILMSKHEYMQPTKRLPRHTHSYRCRTAFKIHVVRLCTPKHLKQNTLATIRFDEPNKMQVLESSVARIIF